MTMRILRPEEIKRPKNPVAIENGRTETDYLSCQEMIGAAEPRVVICPEKDYTKWVTEFELQRNKFFDNYSCLTNALWNGIQCLMNKGWKIIKDYSKRWSAVKNGTIPRLGNSVTKVCEGVRKIDGGVLEKDYPTMTPEMTEDEYFKKPTPAEVDKKECFLKDGWELKHEWLQHATFWVDYAEPAEVDRMLQYGPILALVDARDYQFNEAGELMFGGYLGKFVQYNHALLVVKSGERFLAVDSENPDGFLPIAKDYKFGSPKVLYLKKKIMFELVKEHPETKHPGHPELDGNRSVYFYEAYGDTYKGIKDFTRKDENGNDVVIVTGGDQLKTACGSDYKNAAIRTLPLGEVIPEEKKIGFFGLSD